MLLAPLLVTVACGTVDSSVPASQAVPVGNGAPIGRSGADPTGGPTGGPTSGRTGISAAVTAVGAVLTADGFTLYRYAKDRAAPSRSTCTGGCATTWPPVVDTSRSAITGVDPGLMGSVVRPDGTRQLTVGGWPAYRFSRDAAPGDVKGLGGEWTAIGIDGRSFVVAPTRRPAPPA